MKTLFKLYSFLLIGFLLGGLAATRADAGWDYVHRVISTNGTWQYMSNSPEFSPWTSYYCAPGDYWYEGSGGHSSNSGEMYCLAHSGSCMPEANSSVQGVVISSTVSWQGDNPPSEMWVKEQAYASWKAYNGNYTQSGHGTAWTSLGGTYKVTETKNTQGTLVQVMGTADGARWVKVDSHLGVITRSAILNAYGFGSLADNNGCTVDASVSFDIAAIAVSPPSNEMPQKKAPPPHKAHSAPYYPVRPVHHPMNGGAQTGGDPVNLATGEHAYLPDPDITVYNPYGSSVVYERNFHSGRAGADYASPGLSAGWVDTYDVSLAAAAPGTWGALHLTYPNGAIEDVTPILTNDVPPVPTGNFDEPTGSPYFVTGDSGTGHQWQWIEITWKDRTKWRFTPAGTDIYRLTRITNRMGSYISIVRDAGHSYRVTSVTDDSTSPNTLLTFAYNGSDRLVSLTDCYSRKVTYTYGDGRLLSVSQIVDSGATNPPAHYTYGYQTFGSPSGSYLTSVSFLSPAGSGTSTQHVNYDTSTGKVSSLVDANGNQHCFSYDYNNGTTVQVKNESNVVEKQWMENFDPANENISTGVTDAKGYCTSLDYGDSNNPSLPTSVFDKTGKKTVFTYDSFGNVTQATDPRDTSTVYTYDYSAFSLGRLLSVQEGTKTATTFTYYEPSGLVHVITSPKPGTTEGSETVTTTFTYDSLGNVLTKVVPGNPDDQTTTYNYTDDGNTHLDRARIGGPLTITDNLTHVTHFRYDERGNVTSVKDALGNETNLIYNIADQPLAVIYPSTAP